jgi:hypothetical protein
MGRAVGGGIVTAYLAKIAPAGAARPAATATAA